MKGFTITRLPHGATSESLLIARLDEVLAARFVARRRRLKVRLEQLAEDGKVTFIGPWRSPREAPNFFADTIEKAHVGARFRVRGIFNRKLFRIDVTNITKGWLVVEAAKTEIGVHYVFGVENGPEDPGQDAFDCSGLTKWAWATVGIQLPHNAAAQQTATNPTRSPELGDLVFCWFPNSRGIPHPTPSHVGLFIRFIETNFGRSALMLDTRSPDGEPVAFRRQSLGAVVGYGHPRGVA